MVQKAIHQSKELSPFKSVCKTSEYLQTKQTI